MASLQALSYSSVRTYLECPLRWKFLYIDRRPEAPKGYFSFGRTVHSVLEELLRPLVVAPSRRAEVGLTQRTLDAFPPPDGEGGAPGQMMTTEEMLETYARLWSGEGYSSPEEEARYRSLGEEMLRRYHETLTRTPPMPVAVEAHLQARWDGLPIHGYIDRIDRGPGGGLEIVDYKTSRELSREDAQGSDQLSMYQVLVEENYPEPVERLTLYHLRSLTPHGVPRRPAEALDELKGRVGVVRDGIRAASYEPTPGRHCGRCEFKSLCPEFREVPNEARERLSGLVDRFARLRQQENALQDELRTTAEDLHREAEQLGVHRLPGGEGVAIRRREETWRLPTHLLPPLIAAGVLKDGVERLDPFTLERILHDPRVSPELRRQIREAGGRQIRWYWVLEDSGTRN